MRPPPTIHLRLVMYFALTLSRADIEVLEDLANEHLRTGSSGIRTAVAPTSVAPAPIAPAFGARLRTLRTQRHLRLLDISILVSIDVGYLSKIETAARPIPTTELRRRIYSALSLSSADEEALEELVLLATKYGSENIPSAGVAYDASVTPSPPGAQLVAIGSRAEKRAAAQAAKAVAAAEKKAEAQAAKAELLERERFAKAEALAEKKAARIAKVESLKRERVSRAVARAEIAALVREAKAETRETERRAKAEERKHALLLMKMQRSDAKVMKEAERVLKREAAAHLIALEAAQREKAAAEKFAAEAPARLAREARAARKRARTWVVPPRLTMEAAWLLIETFKKKTGRLPQLGEHFGPVGVLAESVSSLTSALKTGARGLASDQLYAGWVGASDGRTLNIPYLYKTYKPNFGDVPYLEFFKEWDISDSFRLNCGPTARTGGTGGDGDCANFPLSEVAPVSIDAAPTCL